MKRLCSLLLVICLLSGLSFGCAASDRTLSEFQKDRIDVAVQELDGYSVDWTWAHYYGKYDGYHIILNPGQLTAVTCKPVGEYSFVYSSSFTMYAYKNGVAYKLQDAYEKGLISDESLGKLHAEHEAMMRAKFPGYEGSENE